MKIMNSNYLLPAYFKKIGWVMLLPFLIGNIWMLFSDSLDLGFDDELIKCTMFQIVGASESSFDVDYMFFGTTGVLVEVMIIGMMLSLIFISFSKELDEDECIEKMRLVSVFQALLFSQISIILGTLFIYEVSYISFLMVSIYMTLLIFVILYNVRLRNFRRQSHE